MTRKVVFGETLTRGEQLRRAMLTSGPGLFWITFFLLIPLLAIAAIAFMGRGPSGELEWRFTLENIKRLAGFGIFGFEPLYPLMIGRTLLLAFVATALTVAIAMPLAFFIATLPGGVRQAALVLVIIPFWTNMLIRTYAWQIIFGANSWISQAAVSLGFISTGEGIYPGSFAVLVVLVCDFLPLMTLPLYAAVEKVDWTIAEAASDLGANGWQVFRHALLPQIKAGAIAGATLVFIAATGQFVVPDLMGGAKTVLLGNAVQQQFGFSRDWPFGAALSCLAMLVVAVGLWIFFRSKADENSIV